jgi:hypothetical protein
MVQPLLTRSQIVPVESSTLGNPREHPKSLDANHLSMCKFKDCNDANYRKFGADVKKLYERAIRIARSSQSQGPLHGAQP